MTSFPQRPSRLQGSSFREIKEEGGLVVLPRRREVKVLNPTAMRVWALLDGTKTDEDLAAALAAEFDVTPEAALADVRALLADMASQGMLS